MNKEMNSTIGIGVGAVILILIIAAGIFFLNREPPLNPNGIAASAKREAAGGNKPGGGAGKRGFGAVHGARATD